jgi:hypothetical protein
VHTSKTVTQRNHSLACAESGVENAADVAPAVGTEEALITIGHGNVLHTHVSNVVGFRVVRRS